MAQAFILDDPAAQERVLEFCRSCGRETYKGRNCWDGTISRARYFAYKSDHPEFREKIEKACHFFYVVALKENPNRAEDVWERIEDRIKHGETEKRIFAEFTYKKDKNGKLILDPKTNQPIPDELVGTAKQYVIQKPCPAHILTWLADKYEKVSQQT